MSKINLFKDKLHITNISKEVIVTQSTLISLALTLAPPALKKKVTWDKSGGMYNLVLHVLTGEKDIYW